MLTFRSPFILTHLPYDVADEVIDYEVRVASFFLDCRQLGSWDGGPRLLIAKRVKEPIECCVCEKDLLLLSPVCN